MSNKERVIAKKNDLQNGQFKKISLDNDEEILLARIDDKFYASAASCPHYGVPLETGVLAGKKLMCLWHHAVFDMTTGALTDPPALQGLDHYQVEVRGENVLLLDGEKGRKFRGGAAQHKRTKKQKRLF